MARSAVTHIAEIGTSGDSAGKEVFVTLFSRVVAATFNTSRNDVVSYRYGIADVAIWDQSNDGVQKSVSPAGN